MFNLGRPDVMPAGDLGVQTAVMKAYGMAKRPTPKELREFAERWKPHRTAAAWYLWRSLETVLPFDAVKAPDPKYLEEETLGGFHVCDRDTIDGAHDAGNLAALNRGLRFGRFQTARRAMSTARRMSLHINARPQTCAVPRPGPTISSTVCSSLKNACRTPPPASRMRLHGSPIFSCSAIASSSDGVITTICSR